ncbi:hypothetical protein D3C80_1635400 [compost metagenome]
MAMHRSSSTKLCPYDDFHGFPFQRGDGVIAGAAFHHASAIIAAFDTLSDFTANVFNQFINRSPFDPFCKALRRSRPLAAPQEPFVKPGGGNDMHLLPLGHFGYGNHLTAIIGSRGVINGIAAGLMEICQFLL